MEANSAEAKHLLAFIERIERLEEDKKQVSEDIKDVYAEAKGTGYDVKIMRKIVSIRKQDRRAGLLHGGRPRSLRLAECGAAALGRGPPNEKGPAQGRAFLGWL
jgi:uncharacterized protein (UPF0335 family)